MTILGFLPIIALLLLWLAQSARTRGLGENFLNALLMWGILIVFFTEGLSLFGLLRQDWTTILWLVFVLLLLVVLLRSRSDLNKEVFLSFVAAVDKQRLLVAGILAIAGITLLIALVAPPNTYDSMTYHMSRVANWVQNSDVRHYQTPITRQLFMSPFAEFSILHFQLLTGTDRFANLVQWISMLGSLTAVWLIAKILGANQVGRMVSVVYAATIPMGILQSTSTQTDYVVTLWFACFVYFLLLSLTSNRLWIIAKLGTALGLAIMTKQSAYIYAFPFLAWFCFVKVRDQLGNIRVLVAIVAIIGATVVFLNAGHYYRNWEWFGSLSGPTKDQAISVNDRFGIDVTLSNVIRNVTFHLNPRISSEVPLYDMADNLVTVAVSKLHDLIGLSVNDTSTTRRTYQRPSFGKITHEDHAGNPLHFMIGGIVVFVILLSPRLRRNPMLLVFVCMVVLGFLFFCSILKWDPWRQRLHLPLFVVMAPAVGICASELLNKRWLMVMSYCLLISTLPWLVTNNTRPLLPVKFLTSRDSILITDRVSQYFPTPRLEYWYREAVDVINRARCRKIGLITGVNAWEYPLWVLFHKTAEHFTIVHLKAPSNEGEYHFSDDICAVVRIGDGKTRGEEGYVTTVLTPRHTGSFAYP